MQNKKAICLISDGLDSPVATFLLEQEGIEVIGLNFDNRPLVIPRKGVKSTNGYSNNQIEKIAQTLVNCFKYQKTFEFYIISNGFDLQKIVSQAKESRIICLLCKRLMFQKAQLLAEQLGASFIVTGEILGEQASQTIVNLKNIESVLTNAKLIRPLIGLNKDEVISIAQKIGTFEHSKIAAQYSCGAVPNKPATHATLENIIKTEEILTINSNILQSINGALKFTFNKMN